jgi:hypothetical protein
MVQEAVCGKMFIVDRQANDILVQIVAGQLSLQYLNAWRRRSVINSFDFYIGLPRLAVEEASFR